MTETWKLWKRFSRNFGL